jgi:hypothetical protein
MRERLGVDQPQPPGLARDPAQGGEHLVGGRWGVPFDQDPPHRLGVLVPERRPPEGRDVSAAEQLDDDLERLAHRAPARRRERGQVDGRGVLRIGRRNDRQRDGGCSTPVGQVARAAIPITSGPQNDAGRR